MNILFVCTGNTCRSPLAEGYLNSLKLDGIKALSAGLFTDSSPISDNSKAILLENDIDLSNHISRQITREMTDNADKIICMSPSHLEALINAGVSADKLSVLGDGIADPYGGSLNEYRRCAEQIFSAIDKIFLGIDLKTCLMDNNDIKDIAKLEKATFSTPWSEKSIRESAESGTIFIKGMYNGEFAGYCGLNTVLDEGYITNIGVLPQFRNKKIGSAILRRIINIANEKKLSFVSLEVRKSNTVAINLYNKFGFTAVGERKNFYTCPQENALIMTKRLDNEDTQH